MAPVTGKISVMNVFHGKLPDSLLIDTTQSSLRTDVSPRPPENVPLPLQEDHIVELRIFIDRSMKYLPTPSSSPRFEFAPNRKTAEVCLFSPKATV